MVNSVPVQKGSRRAGSPRRKAFSRASSGEVIMLTPIEEPPAVGLTTALVREWVVKKD